MERDRLHPFFDEWRRIDSVGTPASSPVVAVSGARVSSARADAADGRGFIIIICCWREIVGARSAASVFEERRRIRSVGTPAPPPAVAVSGARADAASEEASSLSYVVGARSATSIF